jgi:hypothetical protein
MVLLGLLANFSASAQTAKSLKTPEASTPNPIPKKTTEKEKVTTPGAKPHAPTTTTPSRFVGEADLAAYVESYANVLSIRERTSDPFGQFQDPDAKPIVKPTVAKQTRRTAPLQATPFSDIIKLLQVTTIMPKEKRFLVGTRSIKQGDVIPLGFRGKNIKVEVASVSSQQIEFRNLENNETASLKLNLLPVGMTPGTHGITAPGMVPDRPNATIELDPGNVPTENTQNNESPRS